MPESEPSLDSSSVSSADSDDSDYRLAQKEWEDSLQQLQQLISIVLLPFFGKWLGKRWSYWAYDRYLRLGFGKSFFLGARGIAG